MLQKNGLSKIALLLLSAASLQACGGLAGKASKSQTASTFTSNLAAGTAVSIASVYPSDGYQATVPTTVNVSFSSANLDQGQLAAVSTYSMTCGGGNAVAASSVNAISGVASVSVSFAANSQANGTVCVFTVASNLKDGLGNFVTGSHTASYTINSSTSSTGWNPALFATPTASVGSSAGSGFSGIGADGMILQGLLVNGTQSADGIVGVWANRFASTSLSYGQPHGASAGGYNQISCPSTFRLTGIYGKAGGSIDSIGIVCKNESQSQTYRSATAGGTGGSAYELSCPAGQFATELIGRAGSFLNQLTLGCR